MKIIKRCKNLWEVQTDFGLRVTFDGISRAYVYTSGMYMRKLCGICGNYDGNKNNDNLLPNGKVAKDSTVYGDGWAHTY